MKNIIELTLFVILPLGLITSVANADSGHRHPGTHANQQNSAPPQSQGIHRHRSY